MKTLLIINGKIPDVLPDISSYSYIACTDGALLQLIDRNFDISKIDCISGDFDSIPTWILELYSSKLIATPNQDFTDFHKALDILVKNNRKEIEVLGGSGGEMDHFLGNISTAFLFKEYCNLTFIDEYGYYFFPKERSFTLSEVQGKLVSVYPFPEAKGIYSRGLEWELNDHCFHIHHRIGTRNKAVTPTVDISIREGEILLFVGK